MAMIGEGPEHRLEEKLDPDAHEDERGRILARFPGRQVGQRDDEKNHIGDAEEETDEGGGAGILPDAKSDPAIEENGHGNRQAGEMAEEDADQEADNAADGGNVAVALPADRF